MSVCSRRCSLRGVPAPVIAAGAISSIPGLPAVLSVVETQGPADVGAADTAVADEGDSSVLSEPLGALIGNLATGEIGLFSGTREITLLDPQLANRLARAIP